MRRYARILIIAVSTLATGSVEAQTRDEKVRNDRKSVEAAGYWIYNDLARGYEEAKKTGKPLLVGLRCIPCEECVKLDDELIHEDKHLRTLLDQFVRVRIISTNGLDLSKFQYDYDQSFGMFMLNADGTIYGRYGTRSHRTEWEGDVSVEGLAAALEGTLTLHKDFAKHRDALAAKTGPKPRFPVPEQYPALKGKYGPKIDFDGAVARSCIHCHQIGDAERTLARATGEVFDDRLLFPYPHPKAIGLTFDPKLRPKVTAVGAGSPAARSGFAVGDELLSLAGQPMLSIADVQWVLNTVPPAGGTVAAVVRRAGGQKEISLKLEANWRRADDISWRASTWQLRRFATGGMFAVPADAELRNSLKIPASSMALKLHHVGQFAPHDGAQKAGLRKGDVVVSFDDRSDFLRETDMIAHSLRTYPKGGKVAVEAIRDGKRMKFTITLVP